MQTSTPARQPRGTRTGGQFATQDRTDADITLTPEIDKVIGAVSKMIVGFATAIPDATEEQKRALADVVTASLIAGKHPAEVLGIDVPDEHLELAREFGAGARREMSDLVWAAARVPETRNVRDLAAAHAAGAAGEEDAAALTDDDFADTVLRDIDIIAERWTGTWREMNRLATWAQTQRHQQPTPVKHPNTGAVRDLVRTAQAHGELGSIRDGVDDTELAQAILARPHMTDRMPAAAADLTRSWARDITGQ